MSVSEDRQRYLAAVHAVQSGVKETMAHDERNAPNGDHSHHPKHLRVGVNMAMVDHAGLVALLMEKGIITEAEYTKAMADAAEAEQANYERLLSLRMGAVVKLA